MCGVGSQAGLTPLMEAAKQGNSALMKSLIEAKADQALKDPSGYTALVLAEKARDDAAVAVAEGTATKR